MRPQTYNGTSYFKQQEASDINAAIAELPTAASEQIYNRNGEELNDFQGIKVTLPNGRQEYVNCPTKRYKIVQHSKAFDPILEGLKLSGNHDFKFVLYYNDRFAKLQVYTGQTGYDTVSLGFSAVNSFDSTTALKYGIKMDRKTKTLELVGYRQICSNGMKIKVPLDQAEIIKLETVERIQSLIQGQERILHTKSAEEKLQRIQYVVEALSLLHKPVEAYINRAKEFSIADRHKLMQLVKLHVGERYAERVAARYRIDSDREGTSLWSLYNAITYVASHEPELKTVSRENLIDKAADMLLVEVYNRQPKTKVKA